MPCSCRGVGLGNGITLAVGALLLLQVGGLLSLGRSGPVKLLVYRIHRHRRMALCIAGIVGRRSTDIALDFDEMYKVCGLDRWCAACIWMPPSLGIWWVRFTLLVSPLRHIQHTHKPSGQCSKMKKNVAAFIAVQHVVIYKTQGYHNSETVWLGTDMILTFLEETSCKFKHLIFL